MTDTVKPGKVLFEEIENRKNLGDRKFHSEVSLQNFAEPEAAGVDNAKDPGVMNEPVAIPSSEDIPERRRTMSQPGPSSGALSVAANSRRRRPPRSVMYAPDTQTNDPTERLPKLFLGNREDFYYSPSPNASPTSFAYLNGNYKNGDIKSLSNYRVNTPLGSATPRKRSVTTMDAQSIRSMETQAPPPTTPEENTRLSTKYLSLILSCMYAVLLVTLGVIIYASDPFLDINVSPIYSLVLLVIGFLYQIYLIIDITKYKTVVQKNQKIKWMHNKKIQEFFRAQEEEAGPGGFSESIRAKSIPPAVLIPVNHNYCFSTGRHSGSFYLKMGAAAFALGHLIHSVLLITTQISFFFDNNIANEICIDIMQVILDFCQPLYCFLQLFFIFKYSNVLIIKGQNFAYFGFMHMIGSSLCFWISTIVREILLALTIYANSKYGNKTENEFDQGTDTFETYHDISPSIDISDLYRPDCQGSVTINRIVENFSPYLYPFGVEFNILIVAVYYIIWNNIGHCPNEESDNNSSLDDNTTVCKIPTANEENDFTSNMVIYADCHASNKGMFLGLILTVIVAGMLILGFIFSTIDEEFLETGYLLNSCTKLGLHSLLFIGSVVAFSQTRKLDINEHPISLLDDILLFICLPAFFMETVFSLVATVNIINIIRSIDVVLMVIQVVVQTSLLVDGLRRCSNSRKLRRRKPARELLMFLLIANVAMWLFHTFSYKSPDSLDERYEFYGKVIWGVLGHISLPLIMFYRFHSSVCFADMWDAAYKPGSEH